MGFAGKKEDEAPGWEEELGEGRFVSGEFFCVGIGFVGSGGTEGFNRNEVDDFESVDHVLEINGAGVVFPCAELAWLSRVAVDVDEPAGFAEFVNSLRDRGGIVANPEEGLQEKRRVKKGLPASGSGESSEKHKTMIETRGRGGRRAQSDFSGQERGLYAGWEF